MGAAFWRITATGLNITAMLTVGTAQALTDLSVPGKVWVLWTIAAVAWLAYSAHLTDKENERRRIATEKMISDLVERARQRGATQ